MWTSGKHVHPLSPTVYVLEQKKSKIGISTPLYPHFAIQKWGLWGYTLNRHVFLMRRMHGKGLKIDLHILSEHLVSSIPESQSSLLSQIELNGMQCRVPGHWYSFGKHGIRFWRCGPETRKKNHFLLINS